jgi:hypothetical protein
MAALIALALATGGCGSGDSAESIARDAKQQAESIDARIAIEPPPRDATPQQKHRAAVIAGWRAVCDSIQSSCESDLSRCQACLTKSPAECVLICNSAVSLCSAAVRCYKGLVRWDRK